MLDEYAEFDHPNRIGAIKLIYDHVKDSESGPGKSIILSEGLENVWLTSKRGALGLFSALCQLFWQWGRHEEIFSAMESFFIQHSRDIVKRRSAGWVNYINGLDLICQDRNKDLTKALGHVLQHRSFNIYSLHHLDRQGRVSHEVILLLEELLDKKRKRRNRRLVELGGGGFGDLILREGYSGTLDYPRTGYARPAIDYDGDDLHYMVDHERDRLEVIEPPRRMPPFLGQPFPIHSEGCPNSLSSISNRLEELSLYDRPDPYLGDDILYGGQAIDDRLGLGDLDPFYSSERLGIME